MATLKYRDKDGTIKKIRIPDGSTIVVDSELSEVSENPVQNKVVTDELNKKIETLDDESQAPDVVNFDLDSELSLTSVKGVQNKAIAEEFQKYANGTKVVAKATEADTATKATQDAQGNTIDTTYAKKTEVPQGTVVDDALSSTSANPVQNKVVKAEFDKVNSNLSDLAYGDNGGYNIFKDTTWFVGRHITENGISDYAETGSAYSDYISIVEPNTYYISSFTHPKSTVFEYDANKSFIKYNGWEKDNNTPCVLSGNCAYIRISFNGASSNIQPSNVMLAKTPNLPYVPYIPSVKMLAEENAQQNTEAMDLKMLGWSVPKECPVQNYVDSDGVFHQIVGRVDLGSLNWRVYDSTRFISNIETAKAFDDSIKANAFCKSYKVVSKNKVSYINMSIGIDDAKNVWLRNNSYTDAAELKNSLQGVYLYYELAEEKTINVDGNEAVTKVNDLSNIKDGTTPAAKAVADEDGNNIKSTYAKKTEVVAVEDVEVEFNSELFSNPTYYCKCIGKMCFLYFTAAFKKSGSISHLTSLISIKNSKYYAITDYGASRLFIGSYSGSNNLSGNLVMYNQSTIAVQSDTSTVLETEAMRGSIQWMIK